jgi:hypothetical protein
MKKINQTMKSILMFLFMNFIVLNLFAQLNTLCVKGVVIYAEEQANALNGEIVIGDSIEGTITYDLSLTDDNSHGYAGTDVGDYYNTSSPTGMVLTINGYTFQTNSSNVDFLVEIINDHKVVEEDSTYHEDAIVFRSYNNVFSSPLSALTKNHISWQLVDGTHQELTSIDLPTSINISSWPFVHNGIFGLTITGQTDDHLDPGAPSIFIRTRITEVATCEVTNIFKVAATTGTLSSPKITVYPNPMVDLVSIEIEKSLIGSSYILSDQSGKKVLTGKLMSEKTTVNTQSLIKGEYFIQLENQNGSITKIIKN